MADNLDLSPQQLKVLIELRRIRMAQITLRYVFTAFSILMCAFLYAVFFVKNQGINTSILGVIDGTLGWSVKAIVGYLFNSGTTKENQTAVQGAREQRVKGASASVPVDSD